MGEKIKKALLQLTAKLSRKTLLETELKEIQDNFHYEILAFEEWLKQYDVEEDEHKRMVLAREIALIEHIGANFDYKGVIAGDGSRQLLQQRVLDELVNLTIPKDDDQIRIGIGGSKPRNRVRKEKKAIILLGLPASGKSTVAQVMSDMQGAYIIDSDFAKRKFPELAFPNGAGWTHEESDRLVHHIGDSVIARCLQNDANMVIPKVGSNPDTIRAVHELLTIYEYEVSLGLVWLDPDKAVKRAIERYQKSKRYVPITKIIGVSSSPKDVFYSLVDELELHGHVELSSDVPFGEPCTIKNLSSNCVWW